MLQKTKGNAASELQACYAPLIYVTHHQLDAVDFLDLEAEVDSNSEEEDDDDDDDEDLGACHFFLSFDGLTSNSWIPGF